MSNIYLPACNSFSFQNEKLMSVTYTDKSRLNIVIMKKVLSFANVM